MKLRSAILAVGIACSVAGCHTDLWVQPKVKTQSQSPMFADGMGSRLPVDGTVARGKAHLDDEFYLGRVNGQLVQDVPAEKAMQILKLKTYKDLVLKGKERFEIYCTPCHGALGDGKGMIAQRGLELKRPPGNYHTDRLLKTAKKPNPGWADGYFFEVMTNGYGVMYSSASRVEPAERWAIVTYIRALQRSQNATPGDLERAEQAQPAGGGE